jgi:hypothetical protein
VRATCAHYGLYGPDGTKARLERGESFGGGEKIRSQGYIKEWVADQEAAKAQEKRMNKTAGAAFWSAVGSVVSAAVALIALFVALHAQN